MVEGSGRNPVRRAVRTKASVACMLLEAVEEGMHGICTEGWERREKTVHGDYLDGKDVRRMLR